MLRNKYLKSSFRSAASTKYCGIKATGTMNINLFEKIAGKASTGLINGQPVDALQANAILTVHKNLNEANRRHFMAMPLDDILAFTNQHLKEEKPSFKQYLKKATEAKEQVREHVETLPEPIPDPLEEIAPEAIPEPPPIPIPIEPVAIPPEVVHETIEMPAATLKAMSAVVGRTAKLLVESQRSHAKLSENIISTLDRVGDRLQEPFHLLEAHLPLLEAHTASIHKLYEVNDHIITLLEKLIAKVDAISEARPIVNVPPPHVTIAMQEKKNIIKNIERDGNGYITRVTEAEDEPKGKRKDLNGAA